MSKTSYIEHEACIINNSNIVIDAHISNDCALSNEAYLNFEMDLIFKECPTQNSLKMANKQAILQSVSTVQISINGHNFHQYDDVLKNLKYFKNYEFSNFKTEDNSDLALEYFVDDNHNKIRLKWSEPIYHPTFLFHDKFKRKHVGPIECYVSISLKPTLGSLLNSFFCNGENPIGFQILNASMLTKTLMCNPIPNKMIIPRHDVFKSPIGNLNNTLVKSKSYNISLYAVPNKLYIFALPKNPGFYNSNFTSIEKLKLRVNNEISIFKNTTPLILYNMAKQNGYDSDFKTWKKQSICCFDFCKDLNYHNSNSTNDRIDISTEITHKVDISSCYTLQEYELYFIVEYTGSYYKDIDDKYRYNYCVKNHPCSKD